MVGKVIGQFASVEVKRGGWKYKGTEHEQGQMAWANMVMANGGIAYFSSGGEKFNG